MEHRAALYETRTSGRNPKSIGVPNFLAPILDLWFSRHQPIHPDTLMGTSSKELAQKLWKLAGRQHGCFTAAQAIEIGYADSVHLYHVKNGEWTRVFRGVYRLSGLPETPAARCMAALLWTRDKNGKIQGILIAETASAIRAGMVPDTPSVQIGVPKGFRRSSEVPEGIQISFLDSKDHITSKINGLPIQNPSTEVSKSIATDPAGLDTPDYYDWLDYQAVLCPKSS
jgi:hypothetical protein